MYIFPTQARWCQLGGLWTFVALHDTSVDIDEAVCKLLLLSTTLRWILMFYLFIYLLLFFSDSKVSYLNLDILINLFFSPF